MMLIMTVVMIRVHLTSTERHQNAAHSSRLLGLRRGRRLLALLSAATASAVARQLDRLRTLHRTLQLRSDRLTRSTTTRASSRTV